MSFNLPYTSGFALKKSVMQLLWFEISGNASGVVSDGNVAFFSAQLYGLSPHPSWIHSGNFKMFASRPDGGYLSGLSFSIRRQ